MQSQALAYSFESFPVAFHGMAGVATLLSVKTWPQRLLCLASKHSKPGTGSTRWHQVADTMHGVRKNVLEKHESAECCLLGGQITAMYA